MTLLTYFPVYNFFSKSGLAGTVTDKIFQNLKNIKFENLLCVFENFQKSWSRPPKIEKKNRSFANMTFKKLTKFKWIRFRLLNFGHTHKNRLICTDAASCIAPPGIDKQCPV